MVHDLVNGRIDEAHELDFGYRLQALGRHADAHAGNHAFGERGVLHTIGPEALLQSGSGAEHATIDADVLAEDDHARVVLEFPGMRHRNGFDHRDLCHGQWP